MNAEPTQGIPQIHLINNEVQYDRFDLADGCKTCPDSAEKTANKNDMTQLN
jgi:hypothetical protein